MRVFLVRPKKVIRTQHWVLTPDMEEHIQSNIHGEFPTFNEIANRYKERYHFDIRTGPVNISDFICKKVG